MRSRIRGLVAVTCIALSWSMGVAVATEQQPPMDQDSLNPFTTEEVVAFLQAAAKADAIVDPMQRCLQFPNPPRSHWKAQSVEAYCTYRFQPTLSFHEFKSLIESGKAAEIDQRLSDWAADPKHHPESFWHFLSGMFGRETDVSRRLLESWKQQCPQSAYAHAASGYSFLIAAWNARGNAYASDTQDSNFADMNRILPRAEGDLRMAAKLDPALVLPYAVMIKAGMLVTDQALMNEAVHDGLRVGNGSLPLYSAMSLAVAPRWGGSVEAQDQLLKAIDTEMPMHPLLHTVRTSILVDQSDLFACDCRSVLEQAAYRKAFDDVGAYRELFFAGRNALDHGHNEIAVVYLTEAFRFDPKDQGVQEVRSKALASFSRLLAMPPADGRPGKESP
nr:DUF4034 domain-containing protein [Dyella sp. ASV24]